MPKLGPGNMLHRKAWRQSIQARFEAADPNISLAVSNNEERNSARDAWHSNKAIVFKVEHALAGRGRQTATLIVSQGLRCAGETVARNFTSAAAGPQLIPMTFAQQFSAGVGIHMPVLPPIQPIRRTDPNTSISGCVHGPGLRA